MKTLPAVLLMLLPLFVAGCKDEPAPAEEPRTAEEMYAKSQELLKPNAGREGPDHAGSMRWLLQAAHAGHVQAMVDLGGIYFEGGKGVEADPKKALGWFVKASERGDMQSLVFIGEIYFHGYGVERDPEKAFAAWTKAADAGVAEADFSLGNAKLTSRDTVLEAAEHLKKAATGIRSGLAARAATQLAALYWHGFGPLEKDQDEAMEWYRRGAEAGDPQALHIYGLMLLTGEYVTKDEEKGLALLRFAAGQDYLPSMAALINKLRNTENATPEMEQEADAWQKRMDDLQSRAQ